MFGGNNRARTCDPLLVRQMLSQLSYAPLPVSLAFRTRFPQAAFVYYLIQKCLSSIFSSADSVYLVYEIVIKTKWNKTFNYDIKYTVGL